jgi:hypothetical protein
MDNNTSPSSFPSTTVAAEFHAPNTQPSEVGETHHVGVNLHLNKNVKLGLDVYEDTIFTGWSAGGNRGREHVLLDRFQIVF